VSDLPRELRRVAAAGREISPQLDQELELVVLSLMAESARDVIADEQAKPD
jgi:hypothetical protein